MSALPDEWAQKVADAAAQHGGTGRTVIVAETNFGGDMVAQTLYRHANQFAIREVRASDSKIARAQPVSLLYKQGRVHHIGVFPELEDEMTTFTAESNESPNRLDALVWAMTELMKPPPGFFG